MLPLTPGHFYCSLPHYLSHATAQATIPMVDVNGYERRWLLVSLALSPTFIAAYLSLFSWRVSARVLGRGQ